MQAYRHAGIHGQNRAKIHAQTNAKNCRFVGVPVPVLRSKLNEQAKELEVEAEKLKQKLLYLETTHKNSREHIDEILKRSGQGGASK